MNQIFTASVPHKCPENAGDLADKIRLLIERVKYYGDTVTVGTLTELLEDAQEMEPLEEMREREVGECEYDRGADEEHRRTSSLIKDLRDSLLTAVGRLRDHGEMTTAKTLEQTLGEAEEYLEG